MDRTNGSPDGDIREVPETFKLADWPPRVAARLSTPSTGNPTSPSPDASASPWAGAVCGHAGMRARGRPSQNEPVACVRLAIR